MSEPTKASELYVASEEAWVDAFGKGVTPGGTSKTWTYSPRPMTHRAYHDRQTWRTRVSDALSWASQLLRRAADRIEPWHGDDEWYTAPPSLWYTFTTESTFDIKVDSDGRLVQ